MKMGLNNIELKRGDIYNFYLPQLYDKKGEPIKHIQKGIRPCIVVDNDKALKVSPNVKIIPLTSKLKKQNFPFHILISDECLKVESTALVEAETLASKDMKMEYLGTLSEDTMDLIDVARFFNMGFNKKAVKKALQKMNCAC